MSTNEEILCYLTRIEAKADRTDAKVDTHRAESAKRGHEQAAQIELVRSEVTRLNQRVTDVEKDVRELREADLGVARHVSEATMEHEAAIGGAIAHVRTLEESRARDERVQRAIVRELGLDYDAVASADEPSPVDALRKTTLARLAHENRKGLLASAATILILVLQVALHLLGGK